MLHLFDTQSARTLCGCHDATIWVMGCLVFKKNFLQTSRQYTNTIVEPVYALTLLDGNTVACMIVFSDIECSPAAYNSRRCKEFTIVRDSLVFRK